LSGTLKVTSLDCARAVSEISRPITKIAKQIRCLMV
jgi:hypothetical protein